LGNNGESGAPEERIQSGRRYRADQALALFARREFVLHRKIKQSTSYPVLPTIQRPLGKLRAIGG
jgi:hypothetical protein